MQTSSGNPFVVDEIKMSRVDCLNSFMVYKVEEFFDGYQQWHALGKMEFASFQDEKKDFGAKIQNRIMRRVCTAHLLSARGIICTFQSR